MKSAEFLDRVKAKHGLTSDYQVGKFLGLSHSRISMYRTGKREFDDALAVRVAGLLDLPEGYVLAEIQAERASDRALAKTWRNVAAGILESAKGKAHAAGLALLVGITAMSSAGDVPAGLHTASSGPGPCDDLYITRIRRWLARWRTFLHELARLRPRGAHLLVAP